MGEVDTAAVAAELAARRTRLQADLARLTEPVTERGAPVGFGKRAGDFTVLATEAAERAMTAEQLDDALRALEHAEAKLADCSYGRCDRCGRPIAPERLEALPTAALCMECRSAGEAAHTRG